MSASGRKYEHHIPAGRAPSRSRIAGLFVLILAVLVAALLLAGAAVGREVGVL